MPVTTDEEQWAQPARQAEPHHRALSTWDWRFREEALTRPEMLRESTFELLRRNFRPLLKNRIQPWPTFLSA